MDNYPQHSNTFSENEQPPVQPKTVARKFKTIEYVGALTPAQIRLPQDLLVSLRLHAIKENSSVSKLIHQCLISNKMITKAHVTIRDAA